MNAISRDFQRAALHSTVFTMFFRFVLNILWKSCPVFSMTVPWYAMFYWRSSEDNPNRHSNVMKQVVTYLIIKPPTQPQLNLT